MTTAEHAGDQRNDGQPPPLRSVHTTNSPEILHQLRISLLVTIYKAGKLVVVRRDATQPTLINTHFRNFNKPMGLAAAVRHGTHARGPLSSQRTRACRRQPTLGHRLG